MRWSRTGANNVFASSGVDVLPKVFLSLLRSVPGTGRGFGSPARTQIQRGHDFIKQTVTLPTELKKLIDSGFRDEQDCILLKEFQYFGPGELDSDEKKTEYENFLNDIHIDDYVLDPSDEFEYLKVGLEFGKRIYEKHKENYLTDFRVTISFSETVHAGHEIETYGGCVVKFHKVRPSCDDKFRVEDLDKFVTGTPRGFGSPARTQILTLAASLF